MYKPELSVPTMRRRAITVRSVASSSTCSVTNHCRKISAAWLLSLRAWSTSLLMLAVTNFSCSSEYLKQARGDS